MTNVLEYLENSALKNPNKVAVKDTKSQCTYNELLNNSKCVGSFLINKFNFAYRKPIIVFMDKSVEALISFMGIVYAGCFYVYISPEQPTSRVEQILSITKADCIVTTNEYTENIKSLNFRGTVLNYSDIVNHDVQEEKLQLVREQSQDIDPLYCNFTSGSTGVPKGVLVCHRSVIDFMNYFTPLFDITQDDVIGNQAPFDFDVSVKDIFSSLKVGATLVIIPKKLFTIVTQLLDYICDSNVTTLIWAVSALCMVAQFKGLTYRVPEKVNKILFSGEMMPIKQLKTWQKYLPDTSFVNLYGPTEITCNCTYYKIDRDFELDEKLPIGKPFPNERVFLLDDKDELIETQGVTGEICVSGTALALGYFNNPEQTKKAFVQNPLNTDYMETIYRTGDLGYYDENKNLCFTGRKDFQIKYMGHRIELEEIETAINGTQKIQRACCVFDSIKNRIIAYYVGNIDPKELKKSLYDKLPVYMVPSVFNQLEELPITANGKIDRKKLLQIGGAKK